MIQDLEKTLWATADKLRNNMDAAEYKHIVLGLIFLKYISDSFEDLYNKLKEDKHSDAEDKDEYLAENVFYVPPSARWNFLQHQRAKLPTIGKDIDDAMDAIEKDNPSLKGVLPKDYARPALDKKRLGELVDLVGNIGFKEKGHSSKDLLGRVYEYFLGMFADAEGKRGGQFYTPESIVKLLVEMLNRIMAAFMTAAAEAVVCLYRVKSSYKHMAVVLMTLLFMVRKATRPPTS
jgi:type I restriction enzyme M protein